MLEPWLVSAPAGAVAATAIVYAVSRLLALIIALRGTQPSDRPEILRALGEFFRWRRPPPDAGGPSG